VAGRDPGAGDEDGRFTALGKKVNIPGVFFGKSFGLNDVVKTVCGR
jgi:hypothetical protein